VILVLAGGATTYVATGAKLKTASKTHPVPVADRSTPRGTLLAMSKAMETGDSGEYVASFTFTTPEELKLQATLERVVSANARFKRALAEKFGGDAADRAFANLLLVVPQEVISSANETILGNSATVTFAGGRSGRPIRMTKIKDEWKMAADGFWHLSPLVMNDALGRAVKAVEATVVEIPLDKFATAMDAVNRMKERAR
jgi:hypothetical protein